MRRHKILIILGASLLWLCMVATPQAGAQGRRMALPGATKTSNWAQSSSLKAVRHRAGHELRESLNRHSAHLRRRYIRQGRQDPVDQLVNKANKRFLQRYATRLMRVHGRVDPGVLPDILPPLPATNIASVQRMVDQGISRTRTAKELYLYLERRASTLRGSSDPSQREGAREIVAYLASYKKQWAGQWVDQLLGRQLPKGRVGWRPRVSFRTRGRPQDLQFLPALWPSTSNEAVKRVFDQARPQTNGSNKSLYIHLENQVGQLRRSGQRELAGQLRSYLNRYKASWFTEQDRAMMKGRVAEAWGIIRRLVSPEILARMPRVDVQVDPFYKVPGILPNKDGSKRIQLVPNSSVKDILHEFGHLVEDYGGVGPLAAAHALRSQRAYGGRPVWLGKLIERTYYSRQQRGLRGGFLEPYIGRYYDRGWTEILSMGLERMESRERALRFFQLDGYHFLLTCSALQKPRSGGPVPSKGPGR